MILASPGSTWTEAEKFLLGEDQEKFGFFLCGVAQTIHGPRFCVKEFVPVEEEHRKNGFDSDRVVDLDLLLDIINRAKKDELAIVEAHTHPLSGDDVTFSFIDNREMPEFVGYAMDSLDGRPYGAIVLSPTGLDGRYWETPDAHQPMGRVLIAGDRFRHRIPTSSPVDGDENPTEETRYDRQVRFLGKPGQRRFARLRVGVAGVGGIGSHVAQQLAYLGVKDYLLVDLDDIEESNLNRTVGAYPEDVGSPKVEVAARHIRSVATDENVQLELIQDDVRSKAALRSLLGSDLIFGCVDNDGARQVLNELATAGNVPYIDSASGVITRDGDVAEMGGRVAVAHPDGPCLHCLDEIDRREARYFLKSPAEREEDRDAGYIDEEWEIPNPSVVSLNGVIASTAVNEALLYAAGIDSVAPLTYHYVRELATEFQRRASRTVEPNPDCYTCSLKGAGDGAQLYRYGR